MFDSLRENFELIIVVLFLISTVAYLIYRATFYKDIKKALHYNRDRMSAMSKKERKNLRYSLHVGHTDTLFKKTVFFFADLFWVLLFVVVVRSFLFEPFIIPSSSMKPGLQIGDIVLVNKFEKGLRLPVTNQRLTDGKALERGDVIVFKYPRNPKISYIKRVIGLPGDKVYYDNRHMTINGQPVEISPISKEDDLVEVKTPSGVIKVPVNYDVYSENLTGNSHTIRYAKQPANYPARDWTIPEGKYLVMGDNRDNSADGRDFGFLDDELLIGRATRIAFNFDCLKGEGKCDRFFKEIK